MTRDHLCWARPLSEGRQCALTRHTPAFGGESGNTPARSSSPLRWFVFHVHIQNRVGFSCWKPSPWRHQILPHIGGIFDSQEKGGNWPTSKKWARYLPSPTTHALHCRIKLYICGTIRTRTKSVRRQLGKGTSENELNYKDTTKVIRNRYMNQQAKKVDSRAIYRLIAVKTNLGWDINSLNSQTNKYKYCWWKNNIIE